MRNKTKQEIYVRMKRCLRNDQEMGSQIDSYCIFLISSVMRLSGLDYDIIMETISDQEKGRG